MGDATAFPPSGTGSTAGSGSTLTWSLIAAAMILLLAAGNLAIVRARKRNR
jgi:hypothetical protein